MPQNMSLAPAERAVKKRGVQRPARYRVSGRCGPTPTTLKLKLKLKLKFKLKAAIAAASAIK
ncbi:hypothetical protein C5Y41_06345 [Rahnella variigena]|nr:hypothetical protein C5Y41_06345 [Rahnella variigena]